MYRKENFLIRLSAKVLFLFNDLVFVLMYSQNLVSLIADPLLFRQDFITKYSAGIPSSNSG